MEDIWGPGRIVVVPTNNYLNSQNQAVMGMGLALQAKRKFPSLPRELGSAITQYGGRVFYFPRYGVYAFPTKNNPYDDSADLNLIRKSAQELLEHVTTQLPPGATVWVPMVGCGPRTGKLDWFRQVKPVLLDVWKGHEHRFHFVEFDR